ncbi:MAG: hypothetical protein M1296_02255, partial [Chloroflexi bacterium]|nr:hypothetical protein [Chloroflexota bacterium]
MSGRTYPPPSLSDTEDELEEEAPAFSLPDLFGQVRALFTVRFLLAAILLLAAAFRFIGLNWDDGTHIHPDERFLTMVETALVWPTSNFLATYFNEATSKLNPANVGYSFFVYGDF